MVLRVGRRLTFKSNTYIKPIVTYQSRDIRIEVLGDNGATAQPELATQGAFLEESSLVYGMLLAPRGTVRLAPQAYLRGSVVARDFIAKGDSDVEYTHGLGVAGSGCVAPCNDDNPCTLDVCMQAATMCEHLAISFQQSLNTSLGAEVDTRPSGLGGWSISAQHVYDAQGQMLLLGDGSRRNAEEAKGGTYAQSLVRSSEYRDFGPLALAVGPDGSKYVTINGSRILRLSPDGTETPFAGTGTGGFSGDGGLASAAQILFPSSLTVGSDGSVYFYDAGNYRVRRVLTNGTIMTVAGSGVQGYSGDGGPAVLANLSALNIAVGPDGSVYISEPDNRRVRRVTPDGVIETVAGTGELFALDPVEVRATESALTPYEIAVGPFGDLYIGTVGGSLGQIRRVDAQGIIHEFAGCITDCVSAYDGAPAFDRPIFLAGEEAGGAGTFDGLGGLGVAIFDNELHTLPKFGRFPWENTLAQPKRGVRTVLIGMEDGPASPDNQLYMYVGMKERTRSASPMRRNGLDNGKLYVFVSDTPGVTSELTFTAGSVEGHWVELPNPEALTDVELEAASDAAGAFGFIRTEDGGFDPQNPDAFYFVSTGSGTGNELGRGYKMTLDSADPTGHTVIEHIYSADQIIAAGGDTAISPDNLGVSNDHIMIQEDGTTQSRAQMERLGREASVWRFNKSDYASTRIAALNPPARDAVDIPVSGTWETTGIIPAPGLGKDSWFFAVQAHAPTTAPAPNTVEDGQVLLLRRTSFNRLNSL